MNQKKQIPVVQTIEESKPQSQSSVKPQPQSAMVYDASMFADEMKSEKDGMKLGELYIVASDIVKSFHITDGDIQVLKGVNVTIRAGEFVIIFGPSGCGKSTLLHTLLGLEAPTSGQLIIDKQSFYTMTEDERAMYRRHHFGIIYQQPLWISSLDVKQNVGFSLHLLDMDKEEITQKVRHSLALVRMEHWADYHPTELSSGQQQKISLARSMTLNPKLIVADEPTGNLDTVSGQELINIFCTLNRLGKTIIMVTHDLEYLQYGTHLIHMVDGQIVEEDFQTKTGGLQGVVGKRGTQAANGVADSNVRDPNFLKNIRKSKK